MLKKLFAHIVDLVLGLLVGVYLVFEELVWENIAEPVYRFIHSLEFLRKPEAFIRGLDRHILLALFLGLFVQVELLGLVALKWIGTGKIISGTLLYAGKIPIAAFTFWLFRISKDQLMTFGWFKRSYDGLIRFIDTIKSSVIYHKVIYRLKPLKGWLKLRLQGGRLFVRERIASLFKRLSHKSQ